MSGNQGKPGEISARNQDRYRALIKVKEIIIALQNHVLGKAKMTNTMVRAGEILLRKVSPDLLATALIDSNSSALPVLQIVRGRADTPPESATGPPRSKVSTLPAIRVSVCHAQITDKKSPGQARAKRHTRQ